MTAGGHGATDCSVQRCVALTFDDGPLPATDPGLLQILASRGVKATFFVVGESVTRYPGTLQQIAAAGHEIGNHSYSHPKLTSLSAAQVRSEIQRTQQAVASVTGAAPRVLRPPYGAHDAATDAVIADMGLRRTLWNVDTLDWKTLSPAATLQHVQQDTHRDSIILMHDTHPTSVAAVADSIDWLQAQGYTLVTVSDLQDG